METAAAAHLGGRRSMIVASLDAWAWAAVASKAITVDSAARRRNVVDDSPLMAPDLARPPCLLR